MSSPSVKHLRHPERGELDVAQPWNEAREITHPSAELAANADIETYRETLAAQLRTVQQRLLDPVPDVLYANGVIGFLPNGGANTVGKQVRHFLSQAEHILVQLCDRDLRHIDLEGRRRDREAEICPVHATEYAEAVLALLSRIPNEDRAYTFKSEYGDMCGTITATSLFEQQIQHGITHGAAIIAAGLPQAKRSVWFKAGRDLPKVLRFQVHPDLFIAPSTRLPKASNAR